MLTVLSPGPLTLIQDGGRPGLWDQGVGESGAFDRRALHQANALVGNAPDTAVLEVLGGGLVLRAEAHHTVAVTGAVVTGAPNGRALPVDRGDTLRLGPATAGLRAYVAVAGGFEPAPALGSRASDTLSGLGPVALTAGTVLPVGEAGAIPEHEDVLALLHTGETTVRIVLGPRDDWFSPGALRRLLDTAWTVSPDSNRIGVRLDGPALERAREGEVPSEPCVRGSIQVTSAGQPIVLGPDHPVTGGYPVIAVVRDRDTDMLAQVRPGDTVRFTR